MIKRGTIVAVKIRDDGMYTAKVIQIDSFKIDLQVKELKQNIILFDWVKALMDGRLVVHRPDTCDCYNRTVIIKKNLRTGPGLLSRLDALLFSRKYLFTGGRWICKQKMSGKQYQDGFFVGNFGYPRYYEEKDKFKLSIWRKQITK